MPITSFQQLRETAPPELRDLDDRALIAEYSRRTGINQSELLSYFGVRPAGTLGEMGRGLVGGAISDLPRMVGKGIQAFSEPGRPAYQLGEEMAAAAERRGLGYEYDPRGRGLGGEILAKGARALPPVVPAIGAAFVPGGQVIAPTVAAGLFGPSAYQESYEKLIAQGVPEAQARSAALGVGLTQGVGEAAVTAVTGGLLRPAQAALRAAPRTTAGVAQAMTDTAVLRPFARAYGTSLAVQPATEVAQDLTSAAIEEAAGATPEDKLGIARESFVGGLGLAVLLGPLQLGASTSRARQARSLADALYSPDAPPEVRNQARQAVVNAARQQGVSATDADAWFERQYREDMANNAALQQQEQEALARRQQELLNAGATTEQAEQLLQTEVAQPDFWQRMSQMTQPSQAIGLAIQDPEFSAQLSPDERQTLLQVSAGLRPDLPAGVQEALTAQAAEIIGRYRPTPPITDQPVDLTQSAAQTLGLQPAVPALLQPPGAAPAETDLTQPPQPTRAPLPLPPGVAPVAGAPGVMEITPPQPAPEAPAVVETAPPVEGAAEEAAPAAPAAPEFPAPARTKTQTNGSSDSIYVGNYSADGRPVEVTVRRDAAGVVTGVFMTQQIGQRQVRLFTASPATYARVRAGRPDQDVVSAAFGAAFNPRYTEPGTSSGTPVATPVSPSAAPTTAAPGGPSSALSEEAQEELGDLLDNLEARISSEPGVATGRVTLPQSVLAGLSRMLRTRMGLPPIAYVPKTLNQVDTEATQKYAEQMTRISQAADEVIAAADTLYNAEANLVPTESKAALQKRGAPAMSPAQKEARAAEIAADALRNVTQLRIQLKTKIDALREAAGTDRNVEAVVAVTKAGSIKSRRGKDVATQSDLTSRDVLLSSAWARYKEGALDEAASADMVRGTPIRKAVEAKKSTLQPLTSAAVFGERRRPTKTLKPQTGFLGVMSYIQLHGTGFERLISAAINKALSNSKLTPPTLKWIDAGATPYYDPTKNEVGIHETASPEQALHEGLHAALQWYVYQNPNIAEVLQLEAALKRVLDYKGEMSPKAAEVVEAIRKVYGTGKTKAQKLDAVLELVSYGTTLRDFRNLLKQMESAKTEPGLLSGISALWKRITALVQKFLGVSNTVANDVLDGTVALLEQVATAEVGAAKPVGNILRAEVQSNAPAPKQAPNITKAAQPESRDAQAQAAGFPDYKAYSSRPAAAYNLTRLLFERIGFGKDGPVDKAVQRRAAQAAQIIKKNFPLLEGVLLNINSRFGQTPEYKRFADYFKLDALTGLQEAEQLAQHIYSNPKDATKIFRYLDGNRDALAETGRDAVLRSMADNITRHLQQYISSLPTKQQKLFEGLTFTQYLINPESIAELAGKSMGIKSLRKALQRETRKETTLDAFKQYLTLKDGVLDPETPLYQIMESITDAQGKVQRVPMGFISTDKANANSGLDIDRTRVWFIDKPTKEDARQFVFVTRRLSGPDLKNLAAQLSSGTLSPVQQEEVTQQLSAALLTTVSALSHNYAAKNFFTGLSTLGRNTKGEPSASSIAFDSVEQINATFPDARVNTVLNAASDEARTGFIKRNVQRTGTWVQLPKTDTYGALAGKIIPGTVWSNMLDMYDRTPLLGSETLNTIMSAFKKSKTVLSPATHANNILTNYSLMLLHGIPQRTLVDAAKLFYRYEVSPNSLSKTDLAIVQSFYNSGAVLGQYTNTEAKKFIAEKLAQNLSPDQGGSFISKMTGFAKYEQQFAQRLAQLKRAGALTDSALTELYAAGDNVFRLAAFMHTAGNVQTRDKTTALNSEQLREVGLAARKMFLDYDIDARWVRAARQSVLPFVSWSYAILPVLGRLAIHKPWTMVNMLAAIGLMNALMDGDDDEWRRTGPEQVREKSLYGLGPHSFMRMPFGDDENPVFWNIGKSIPMLSLFQPPMGETKLLGQDWVPGFLNPSGPYVTLVANTFLGIDPFTAKPMYTAADSQWDKLLKAGEAVYNTMAPTPLSTRVIGPEEGQIAKFLQDRAGPTGSPPDALFIARTLGLTMYEFDRSEVQFYQDAEVKKIKREFSTIMNQIKRTEMSKGYPDFEDMDNKLADLEEKLKQRIAEIRGDELE